ncbi:hypothetical protein ACFXPX_13730 [Kitasatospora sp. NPDC059146]
MSSQHLGDAALARRLEGIRQAQAATELARRQAEDLRAKLAGGA